MVIERPETWTGDLDKAMLCPQAQGKGNSNERAAAFSCRQPPKCLGRDTHSSCASQPPSMGSGQLHRNSEAAARAYRAEAEGMSSYDLGWWGSELPGQRWPRSTAPT